MEARRFVRVGVHGGQRHHGPPGPLVIGMEYLKPSDDGNV